MTEPLHPLEQPAWVASDDGMDRAEVNDADCSSDPPNIQLIV